VAVDVSILLPGGGEGGSEKVTSGAAPYPEPPAVT